MGDHPLHGPESRPSIPLALEFPATTSEQVLLCDDLHTACLVLDGNECRPARVLPADRKARPLIHIHRGQLLDWDRHDELEGMAAGI